jgi:hypothetical protein
VARAWRCRRGKDTLPSLPEGARRFMRAVGGKGAEGRCVVSASFHQELVARNQALLRDVNDRVAELSSTFDDVLVCVHVLGLPRAIPSFGHFSAVSAQRVTR